MQVKSVGRKTLDMMEKVMKIRGWGGRRGRKLRKWAGKRGKEKLMMKEKMIKTKITCEERTAQIGWTAHW